jgi:hypothetical protein
MSCAARATLGDLKIGVDAVKASYEGVLHPDHENEIAGKAVAAVTDMPQQPRNSPITLISRREAEHPPTRQYLSLDLEDFQ